LPKLSSTESAISILKEEESILQLLKGLEK
jgi:hypothetical protein